MAANIEKCQVQWHTPDIVIIAITRMVLADAVSSVRKLR
jgi:hypothetical protein